jgi:hypothetical protein
MKGPRLQEELAMREEKYEKAEFSLSDTKTYLLPGNEKRTIAFFTKINRYELFHVKHCHRT